MSVLKIPSDQLTEKRMANLAAEGWKYLGPMRDKLDGEGKVVVEKKNIHRFAKEAAGEDLDDVVLDPEDVTIKLRGYFNVEDG